MHSWALAAPMGLNGPARPPLGPAVPVQLSQGRRRCPCASGRLGAGQAVPGGSQGHGLGASLSCGSRPDPRVVLGPAPLLLLAWGCSWACVHLGGCGKAGGPLPHRAASLSCNSSSWVRSLLQGAVLKPLPGKSWFPSYCLGCGLKNRGW